MTTTVAVNEDEGRYEITVDGVVAGWTEFTVHDGVATFPHTLIEPEFGGRGLATELIRAALDDMRSRGLTVVPRCPFVRAFIDKHPDYRDLVHSG